MCAEDTFKILFTEIKILWWSKCGISKNKAMCLFVWIQSRDMFTPLATDILLTSMPRYNLFFKQFLFSARFASRTSRCPHPLGDGGPFIILGHYFFYGSCMVWWSPLSSKHLWSLWEWEWFPVMRSKTGRLYSNPRLQGAFTEFPRYEFNIRQMHF